MTVQDETDRRNTGIGPFRRGRWWRALFSGIWLVYLVQPVSAAFGHHHSPLYTAGALVIFAAFCALYVMVMYRWDVPGDRGYLLLAGLAVLAVVGSLCYGGGGAAGLFIYVSAATPLVVPEPGRALRVVLGVTAAYALFSYIGHSSMDNFLIDLVPTALVGLAMIGFRRQVELNRELSQARETVAKLAASEERLRLARDMHDLTGQSLSMITLKSELAAKILGRLPASADRDRAVEQVTDVARVSRQTLHDIREAVSGYRRPTLAVEIITARTALEAAGIELDDDPRLTMLSGTFDADAEAALAWCLRESVTNVIRHSGARRCRLGLTEHGAELSLEVADDGGGFGWQNAQTQADLAVSLEAAVGPASPGGSGLRGMSERLNAVGGRLQLGSTTAGHGFRLVATVPAVPRSERATVLT
jgi:two-component system, NarL family, sensor histidine kinase DesK